ncbi:MAG TPA: hypothetical protein DFK12_07510 [Gallionellaceae bacterium]|nr:hypothetical protein [Gallionellaceae bacterium]
MLISESKLPANKGGSENIQSSEIIMGMELGQAAGVQQTIVDSFPSVIYQVSLQGGRHEIRISRQISNLGLSADKWGSDAELHHQICYEEDRPIVKNALEHSYKSGTTFQCEYRIKTIGDTLHWFSDKAMIVMDRYESPLFMRGVMTDITSMKTLESELMQYRHMFEKTVRQSTEQLNRRIDILEACNSRLSESFTKVRKMYCDLLASVQAQESGIA